MSVAGTIERRRDAGDVAVDPVDDGAVGVVVEREHVIAAFAVGIDARRDVHVSGVDRAIRSDGIPALPHGRSSLLDLVEPGTDLGAKQHQVGLVDVPHLCQDREDERRTQETGIDATIGFAHHAGQVGSDGSAILGRRDVQAQDHRAAGLVGSGVVRPARPGQPRHVAREGTKLRCDLVVTEKLGSRTGQSRAVCEVGVGEEARVGLGLPRPRRWRIWIEPIAELERLREQSVGSAASDEGAHRTAHAVELVSQHLGIAVRLIHSPRDDRGRVGPARPTVASLPGNHDVGHHRGHAKLIVLLECQVPQPTGPKNL